MTLRIMLTFFKTDNSVFLKLFEPKLSYYFSHEYNCMWAKSKLVSSHIGRDGDFFLIGRFLWLYNKSLITLRKQTRNTNSFYGRYNFIRVYKIHSGSAQKRIYTWEYSLLSIKINVKVMIFLRWIANERNNVCVKNEMA